MDDKWIYFGFGALTGAILLGLYNKKQTEQKVSSFNSMKSSLIEKAKEDGYNEAHANVEKLLIYGQNSGKSPMQLLKIMHGTGQ